MTQKSFLILIVAASAAGCGSGGGAYVPKPIKAAEPVDVSTTDWSTIFPFKVGNQWTFDVQSVRMENGQQVSGSGEVIFRCSKVTPVADGTKAEIEVIVNDKLNETQVWLVNAKGLYQISVGTKAIPFVPMQPAVMFPPEKDRTFTWEGTGMTPLGAAGTAKVKSTVDGPLEVDTGMGPMTAIGITSVTNATVNGKSGSTKSTTWWKPGVGVVRYFSVTTGSSQTLKLKSFAPK